MQQPNATLLADIGGTNARFALVIEGRLQAEQVFACSDYPTLEAAARRYLEQLDAALPRPSRATIAVAAPLTGDRVRMTNHVWQFSVSAVRRELGLDRLLVLNDFTALALSLRHLPAAELDQVGGEQPKPQAPIALIGPGTGLGVSGLIPTPKQPELWIPLQGEGGHATASPMDDREVAVLAVLRKRFGHVSTERVLSGPGLVNLYEALCNLDGQPATMDGPADISNHAVANSDAHCRAALDMFCNLLGTAASNLALTLGAAGGVYIGGGIVPRLSAFFRSSGFRARFEDKGRYREYLAPIPVFVIQSALPAFVGLAHAFDHPIPCIEG